MTCEVNKSATKKQQQQQQQKKDMGSLRLVKRCCNTVLNKQTKREEKSNAESFALLKNRVAMHPDE